MSHIYVDANQIAAFIASKVGVFAVPSSRHRADIGAVQIDKMIVGRVTDQQPAVRLSFETAEGFGVELLVKLREFAASPNSYMRDIFENIQGIRHAGMLRRQGRQAEIATVYEGMQHA